MNTRKVRIAIKLVDAANLLRWMSESRIPFLAKMKHQRPWAKSTNAARFFSHFFDLPERGNRTIDLDLKILPKDIMWIKLRSNGKIKPYRPPKPRR